MWGDSNYDDAAKNREKCLGPLPKPFDMYFNMYKDLLYENIIKLQYCRVRELFGSQITVTTRGF